MLIMSDARLSLNAGLCFAVPGMRGAKVESEYPFNIRIPADVAGLPLETVFMPIHLRALDVRRLKESPIGKLPDGYISQVESALLSILRIGPLLSI